MLWDDSLNFSLLSFSANHIDMKVVEDQGSRRWRLTGIYGWPEDSNKYLT